MDRLVVLLIAIAGAHGQLTAQTSVAPELRECYMNGQLMNRNNLPPTTIGALIDIIRTIEDNPNVNVGLRELAVLLLHTYRQDGIEYHQPDSSLPAANVLPFAPTYHSFYRHKLLVTRLIPNNFQVLANTTLTSPLKCGIHQMLSTTVDSRLRGDESVCNQLSQYRSLRVPRQINGDSDVEILDSSFLQEANKNGQLKQYNPNEDVEYTAYDGVASERQVLGESQCPLHTGVVQTQWGAVSAGNLIAGIAAGSEAQRVSITELVKGSQLNYLDVQPTVSSLYPATLSGDLAEAALIQGTERGATTIQIGAAGGWNSTQARKHYILQSRLNLEMTDAEIRGGIDGFILGNIISSLNTISNLRLSQLLDMYYSPRNGILDSSLRVCNRRELVQRFVNSDVLIAETYAFAAALDTNIPLRGTLNGGLRELVVNAVNNFQQYTSNSLNDLTCALTETANIDYRVKTNLYLVLDSSWQYEAIYPAISYLLDNIEVGKYGSSVTLLNAIDGSLIINKTFSLADFHSQYTLARHESIPSGVNLEMSLLNIRTFMLNELDLERARTYLGGNSTVLLYLINGGNIQNNERVWNEARMLNDTVPDLRILFATSSNHLDSLWNLVRDMHNDIKTIPLSSGATNINTIMDPVLDRIRQTGRRIVNPNCGSQWNSESPHSGVRQFDDFVEPGYANFYTVSPNYFFSNNENTKVFISRTGAGVGSLVVCFSRIMEQPRQNFSTNIGLDENAVQCQTLTTSGTVEISLNDACGGHWTINTCPRLYISVQSVPGNAATTSAICTDMQCRFPYNIRYQVRYDQFGCGSGVGRIAINYVFIFIAFVASLLRMR